MSMYGIEQNIARDSITGIPRRLKAACFHALKTNILNLRFRHITSDELNQYIVPFLNAHSNITGLNIAGNSLGVAEVAMLMQCVHLYSLNISQNFIAGNVTGDDAAQILANHPTLQVLDISANRLGVVGIKALAESNRLICLNISFNNAGDVGAQALANNRSLHLLDASSNNIGEVGAKALAKILTLKHLNLTDNNIGDGGAIGLTTLVNLKVLNVYHNNIGDVGAQALARMPLVVLLIVSNFIGSIGAAAFVNSRTLQVLDIAHNNLLDSGVLALAKSPTIHTLSIAENNVTPEGMKSLYEFIASGSNTVLTSLPDIEISPEITDVLQINIERADPQESQIIKTALQNALHSPIISLVCEYRGESKNCAIELNKVALQHATHITNLMPCEYAYFSMMQTQSLCLQGLDPYFKCIYGITLERQTESPALTFQAPNHSSTTAVETKSTVEQQVFFWSMQQDAPEESLPHYLSKGIDINALSENGETALMMVAKTGNVTCIKLLRERGANARLLNPAGQTAFDLAVELGHDAEVLAALNPSTSLGLGT